VVVDTKFFIQFSTDETRQEDFYVRSKMDERICPYLYHGKTQMCVIYCNNIMLTRDKWVLVTTVWCVIRLRVEERSPVWRVAANITNKQSRTAAKRWSSSLGVGRGADKSSP